VFHHFKRISCELTRKDFCNCFKTTTLSCRYS